MLKKIAAKAKKLVGKKNDGNIGASLTKLRKVAEESDRLETSADVKLKGDFVRLEARAHKYGSGVHTVTRMKNGSQSGHAPSFDAALADLARTFAPRALKTETITVSASKGPISSRDLKVLCIAAWCEAFGCPTPSADELKETRKASKSAMDQVRDRFLADLRNGKNGIKGWNERDRLEVRRTRPFRRANLSGVDLIGADLQLLDFQGATFDGANLTRATCTITVFKEATFKKAILAQVTCQAKFHSADFSRASLIGCKMIGSIFRNARFQNADLRDADFVRCDLCGADFSTANLQNVQFQHTAFDEQTSWPPNFTLPESLVWKGKGPDPRITKALEAQKAEGPIDHDAFMQRLALNLDQARIDKALQMLKAERFKLFVQVEPDYVVGVVKSQTDPDLVYSCKLASDGSFGCCTQNLNACGGLRGALCKHLLVLIVGLTKKGELDPTIVDQWVLASRANKPVLDKDAMSATFLRYKGAEAGEIDWRPTETIPEDYYAM